MKLIKTAAVFLLIAVLLIIGISVAFADSPSGTQTEGISAIKLSTAGISNGNYVYYGKLNGSAVKWRVLDNDATNTGSNTGMFLISEYMIYNSEFNNTTTLGTYYQNSLFCHHSSKWQLLHTERTRRNGNKIHTDRDSHCQQFTIMDRRCPYEKGIRKTDD